MAANNTSITANVTLTTDFNQTPYYDDYDPTKQYYRILYRPGYAVQARELTQMQSMLQSQIDRLGKHVFKEGDIVLPGAFTYRAATNGTLNTGPGNPIDYVKISNVDSSNNTINVDDYYQQTLRGTTSNIAAYVLDVLPSDGTSQNTNTLYVTYLGASPANSSIRKFIQGETLTSNVGTALVLTETANTSNITGKASWFKIDEGVFFAKQHFIYFPTQSVVLSRYNSLPSCQVGFYVSEQIVNYAQDTSLLDPALESTNFSAPGADRLKLVSNLEVVPYDFATTSPDFIPLLSIRDGIIQTTNEKTQYNILGDALASRTYEESGDYVIKGLTVQVSEHLNVTSPKPNYGRYPNTGNPSGNSQLLIASVDPGVGYVKGYSISKYDKTDISFRKPTEYNNVAEQLSTAIMGQKVRVNEFVGTWELNKGNRVNLYDTAQRRITNSGIITGQKWSTGSQSGNNIGNAIVNSLRYVSGIPGYNAQYDIYLSDIKMTGANSFSNVASLYIQSTPYASSGADILGVAASSNTTSNTSLYDVAQASLLYYVGKDSIKTVKDTLSNDKTIYYFNKTEGISSTITMSSSGTITPVLSLGTNQQLPYGNTTLTGLSDAIELSDFVITMGQTFNIGPLWNASVVGNGNRLTSANSIFTNLNIGDKIEIAGQSGTWYITSIANNTTLTLSNTVSASVTSNLIFKAYKTGDIINMAGVGVSNGVARTITTTTTSFTVDIKETLPVSPPVTISYKVGSTKTAAATKTLKPNRYVKINCSTAGINGPFCLGIPDVYSINKIVKKTGSAPTTLTDGTDVTRYFTLNNGQKDTMYDLAFINKLKSLTLGATDYLLISLNYFEPNYTGAGSFFTIDSYPIDDTANTSSSEIRTEGIPVYVSPTSGLRYDLRNHLDFRPVKALTATDSTTVAGASTNPSNNSTSYTYSGQLNFPVPDSQLVYDYSYYLGRIDIVCVNKDGSMVVVEGVTAPTPVTPIPSDNQMIIAIISTPPYPSLSPAYGNVLNRGDLACRIRKASNRVYTMRDIGILDRRISNLEYYTSLTLLEKDALNLQILDENNIDRFKNGIFVDTFRDASLSASGVDPDYRIVTDPEELSIRPLFSTESIKYDFVSGSGVTVSAGQPFWGVEGGIIMLNYTEKLHWNQPRVTDVRELERGTFFFQGSMSLLPKQDVWIDVTQLPDELVTISSNNSLLDVAVSNTANGTAVTQGVDTAAAIIKNKINTVWGNWQATVTGYNLYRGQGVSRRFVGFFTDVEQARQAAAAWTTQQNGGTATLETLYNNSRVGTSYFANFSSDQAAGSNKVISTSTIPYIRPQKIAVQCTNLRGYSKMNAFFDGVNVNDYCTPLSQYQYTQYVAGKPIPANSDGTFPQEGDDLIVDDFTGLYFIFRIPSEEGAPKFRCGQRKLVVIDNINLDANSLDLTEDTSTTATAIFFAQGTAETLQRTVYSTRGYMVTSAPEGESYFSQTDQVLPNTWQPPPKWHCCFDPDAKVLMANCTWKAIKDVMEGEQVIGDQGAVNTVQKNNKVPVSDRKMLKLKDSNFYTTDDHLFLTKKGWKTWKPDALLRSAREPNQGTLSLNAEFLIGENRYNSIDKSDYLKKVKIIDNKIVEDFIPYVDIEAEEFAFDSNYLVHDLVLDGNMTYIVDGYIVHNCCVAYTVLIRAPDEEEGIFCTGFDFYVARKSKTRGIWGEIGIVDSSGQITKDRVPGTEVVFNNAEIPISNTGNDNPVQFRFDSPVFLFNKTPYAFIIHSDSPDPFLVDPDTQIWVSRLGQRDINANTTVTNRQGTGQFWQTTNNVNWSEVPDVDLKIEIYRADFTPTTTSFVLGAKPIEKIHLSNQSLSFKSLIGQHFTTGDQVTLTGVSGTISVGDRLQGNISNSKANSSVMTVIDTNKYQMSNNKYVIGEMIYAYNTTGTLVATANISAISNATAVLSYVDESLSSVYTEWSDSTGGFAANQVISLIGNSGSNYKANVENIRNFNYSTISFQPKVLDFVKTDIQYEMNTYDLESTSASGFEKIPAQDTTYFLKEKQLYSKTNELNEISGVRSNQVRVTFTSISKYVSPVLDLNHTQTILIDNLINANTYGEGLVYDGAGNTLPEFSGNTATTGGGAYNKYISQTITLDEGQDAEDLMVIISSYRPPGTDVLVYAKFMNSDDGDNFVSKNWVRMSKKDGGDAVYSSIADRNNFKDYTYTLPSDIMTSNVGGVQYTNSNGTKFSSFKYYAVKIVLTSENQAIVPRVSELRAIALQM
jgi:hypothetical protein